MADDGDESVVAAVSRKFSDLQRKSIFLPAACFSFPSLCLRRIAMLVETVRRNLIFFGDML